MKRIECRCNKEARAVKDFQLTKRELEVLQLAAQGSANKQIAAKLFITVHTVKVHIQHILQKLMVETRLQAVILCVALGIITVRPPQ